MCGSADGTACLFDTSFVDKQTKNFSQQDGFSETHEAVEHLELDLKDINISEAEKIHIFEEKSDKYPLVCAIDCIIWSANGRYAVCAINIKKQLENN